jgi:hypothetical protein
MSLSLLSLNRSPTYKETHRNGTLIMKKFGDLILYIISMLQNELNVTVNPATTFQNAVWLT